MLIFYNFSKLLKNCKFFIRDLDFSCLLSGDSDERDKLYFYEYESPNKVVDKISVSIDQDSEDSEKSFDPIEIEKLIRKMGFYQR